MRSHSGQLCDIFDRAAESGIVLAALNRIARLKQ
jgi:hypothetical protein